MNWKIYDFKERSGLLAETNISFQSWQLHTAHVFSGRVFALNLFRQYRYTIAIDNWCRVIYRNHVRGKSVAPNSRWESSPQPLRMPKWWRSCKCRKSCTTELGIARGSNRNISCRIRMHDLSDSNLEFMILLCEIVAMQNMNLATGLMAIGCEPLLQGRWSSVRR